MANGLAEIDARNASVARQYISTGASLERRGSKKQEEHEGESASVMFRL